MDQHTAAALAAMLGTAAWSICTTASDCPFETLRCAFVVAGVASALSFLAVDAQIDRATLHAAPILVAYQALFVHAATGRPAAAQAIVNCNTVVILLVEGAATQTAPPRAAVAAAIAMALAAACLTHALAQHTLERAAAEPGAPAHFTRF